MKKLSLRGKISIAFISLLMIILIIVLMRPSHRTYYIASSSPTLVLQKVENNKITDETVEVVRGTIVKEKYHQKDQLIVISHQGDEEVQLAVSQDHLVDNQNQVVLTDKVYARLLVNLRESKNGDVTDQVLERYEAVDVKSIDYENDFHSDTGEVDGYTITKDGHDYYVLSRYVEESLELAKKDYSGSIAYSTYWDGVFEKGYSKETYIDSIDYKPVDKMNYEDNPLKGNINAVHVGMSLLSKQSDDLIDLCKESGINALVLEIKNDVGCIAYQSESVKKYLKDTSQAFHQAMDKEEMKKLIEKYKKENIYLIARIVTFKDPIFASQWKDAAILNQDGSLLSHDGIYWPSAYSREAWRYNVALAKETAQMGFNEIQFDYVRFPDGLSQKEISHRIEFNNTYGENKVQAIQRFLMYAYDELSPQHVYVGADVFGWPAVAKDDQNIGQFIPAISNVVDVISPMPYPDHFGANSLGIAQPWQEPEETLSRYSQLYIDIQNSIPSPALYRSWIQGYACLSYVCTGTPDNPERSYNSQDIIAQIRGIQSAGFEGYMVWSGEGKMEMFEYRKAGFIDSTLEESQKFEHTYIE